MTARPRRRSPRSHGGQCGAEPRARLRAREQRAVELAVQGWSQHQIAADLHISQPGVSKLLRRADERTLQELADRAERHKVRQTQRLEHLFAEAMRAWEQSKEDATRRRQRKSGGDGGSDGTGHTVAEVVVEKRHGDPRYLEAARKALADVRHLWGLNAPDQLEVTDTSPYRDLPEADLLARIAEQDALLCRLGGLPPAPEEDPS